MRYQYLISRERDFFIYPLFDVRGFVSARYLYGNAIVSLLSIARALLPFRFSRRFRRIRVADTAPLVTFHTRCSDTYVRTTRTMGTLERGSTVITVMTVCVPHTRMI